MEATKVYLRFGPKLQYRTPDALSCRDEAVGEILWLLRDTKINHQTLTMRTQADIATDSYDDDEDYWLEEDLWDYTAWNDLAPDITANLFGGDTTISPLCSPYVFRWVAGKVRDKRVKPYADDWFYDMVQKGLDRGLTIPKYASRSWLTTEVDGWQSGGFYIYIEDLFHLDTLEHYFKTPPFGQDFLARRKYRVKMIERAFPLAVVLKEDA